MPNENEPTRRPLARSQAPDPARSYERARPEDEAGMGRLDNNDDATPTSRPAQTDDAVHNRSHPWQINAHEVVDQRAAQSPDESRAKATPDAAAHAAHQSHLHGKCEKQ